MSSGKRWWLIPIWATDVNYSVVIASLVLALAMAWAADFVGLSAVVGAFFGGLAIRQTPQYKAVKPLLPPSWLNVVNKLSTITAKISSTTAAPKIAVPARVCNWLASWRTTTEIETLVAEKTIPINSASSGFMPLILLTTTLLGQLFSRLNMPAVIGQLLSGIVLGPAILNWVKPNLPPKLKR